MNTLIHRLLTLCLGLTLGILAAGGPSPPVSSESGAEAHSTATRQLCQKRPTVHRKGPQVGRQPAPTEQEILWLARTAYGEAPSTYGMIRVAQVVLNRVRHPAYPNTVRGVVTQDWQFTAVHVDLMDLKSLGFDDQNPRWREALRAARAAYALPARLEPLPRDVTHYFSPHALENEPEWASKEKLVSRVGERFEFYSGVNAPS